MEEFDANERAQKERPVCCEGCRGALRNRPHKVARSEYLSRSTLLQKHNNCPPNFKSSMASAAA